MLKQKRIDQAHSNVRSYLNDGLLKKTSFESIIFNTFVSNAKESLKLANHIFKENRSDLWTIVISYYSMFYIANAVLYKQGYKSSHQIPHKVVSDTLIVHVRGKLKDSLLEDFDTSKDEALSLAGIRADELLQSFDFERRKRGSIQYETTTKQKHSKAQTSLDRAKEFYLEMRKLIV